MPFARRSHAACGRIIHFASSFMPSHGEAMPACGRLSIRFAHSMRKDNHIVVFFHTIFCAEGKDYWLKLRWLYGLLFYNPALKPIGFCFL
jgi:hypothetical protein